MSLMSPPMSLNEPVHEPPEPNEPDNEPGAVPGYAESRTKWSTVRINGSGGPENGLRYGVIRGGHGSNECQSPRFRNSLIYNLLTIHTYIGPICQIGPSVISVSVSP